MTFRFNIRLLLASILSLAAISASGNDFRTLSTSDGLSNNAIFSMFQDELGHLWIGTTDGLNIWNGHSLEVFDPKDGKNFFAGNAVRDMHTNYNGGIWIRTYYGIACVDIKSGNIRYYDSLSFAVMMTCSCTGTAYVVTSDKSLHYFNKVTGEFSESGLKFMEPTEECKRLHCHGEDSLYCFTDRNIYLIRIETDARTGETRLTPCDKTAMDIHHVSGTPDGPVCHIASYEEKDIYTFDMRTREISLYSKIGAKLPRQETVRTLLPSGDGLYIGTSASGVYFAPPTAAF